jgi:hypothetical protein
MFGLAFLMISKWNYDGRSVYPRQVFFPMAALEEGCVN